MANQDSDTVSVINTATNTVVTTVPVGDVPLGVRVSPDGTLAYVTNLVDGTVSVISTATNTVTATIPVGNGPAQIAFATAAPNTIGSLIAQVQALIDEGSLKQNKGNGLINKLQEIQSKIDNGATKAACNQLGAFINQIQAFINNGSLTASQGQELIEAANAIQSSLGCL